MLYFHHSKINIHASSHPSYGNFAGLLIILVSCKTPVQKDMIDPQVETEADIAGLSFETFVQYK